MHPVPHPDDGDRLILLAIAEFGGQFAGGVFRQSFANEGGLIGFAGFAVDKGIGDYDWINHISFYTIHGCQVAKWCFLGGGISSNRYWFDDDDNDDSYFSLAIFGNFRADFVPKKVSPYADLRLGGLLGDVEGFYFVPTVGIRISHFSMGVGYEMHNDNVEDYWGDTTYTYSSISFKLTWDWGARR